MIRLPEVSLPKWASRQLARWQREIDEMESYEDRVTAGKTRFPLRNRADNATFRSVRRALTRMCCGARRCGYCEDSLAHQIEHVRPKDFYPESVFVWENFLYACGSCNQPKSNRFAVFATGTRTFVEIRRSRGAPVVPPPDGDPVLLDPRFENPLDFMRLDLAGTFGFEPTDEPGTERHRRAAYTIEVCGLNDRDGLREARAEYFHSYLMHLTVYRDRHRTESPGALKKPVDRICRMAHPSVWAEMKRQREKYSRLRKLFREVPESLNW